MSFFVYGGLKNAIFVYWGLKMLFFVYGGLENGPNFIPLPIFEWNNYNKINSLDSGPLLALIFEGNQHNQGEYK